MNDMFRFDYAGFHGWPARCGLEIIPIAHASTVVICTELSDNPGTSVTNFAEELAMLVCARWRIDPSKLVWIEHYAAEPCQVCKGTGRAEDEMASCRACEGRGTRREASTYDLVTFQMRRCARRWLLSEPQWRQMREKDWRTLGIPAYR